MCTALKTNDDVVKYVFAPIPSSKHALITNSKYEGAYLVE